MTYHKLIKLSVFVMLLFFIGTVQAQTNSTARSMGLARAYTAIARGVAAPIWNPANLAMPDRPPVSIQLVGAGFHVGNVTFSKSMYDRYNGKYLTSSDVNEILAKVPDDGFKLYVDTDVQAIGVTIGSFALTVTGMANSNLSLSKDYLRILLEGIYAGRTYNIGNNYGGAFGYSSVTASYAFPIAVPVVEKLYVGANVSYLRGLGYAEVVESHGQIYHGGYEINGEGRVRARYAQGGAGFATDFGLAAQYQDWQFGLMLKNAAARINWKSKPEEFEAHFYTEQAITVENSADDDSVLKSEDTTRAISAFSTSLPAELRIGAARKWHSLLIAADYHQGFAHRPGVSTKPYVALSSEWQGVGFFPLRLGVGIGGEHGVLLATGFGMKLGFFRLDYGVCFYGGLLPNKASSLGMALSTYMSF